MAERLNAAVLKTVEAQVSVGSNPTPSAKYAKRPNRVAFVLDDGSAVAPRIVAVGDELP